METSDINLGSTEFSLPKVSWLYITLLPAVVFVSGAATIKWTLISAALTFITVCIGHSVGLHRGIIHKSFKMGPRMRKVFIYLFVHTGLGGPLSWLKLHYIRDYWQNQLSAPAYFRYHHSLWKDYYWNLHQSFRPRSLVRYGIPKEDLNDRWFKWLEKTWQWHVLGLAGLIWLCWGFQAMIMLVFVRVALTQLGHWFVGYISHVRGYQNFRVKQANESGFNNWLLGVFSFGEGFHNNHHACPRSARLGMRWFEIDLGWWVVKSLKSLSLIYDVHENPTHDLKANAYSLNLNKQHHESTI